MENDLQATDSNQTSSQNRYRRPFYDILPHEEKYDVKVVMPGVGKEGVKVSIDGKRLTVEGKRQHLPKEDWSVLSREIDWCDYRLALDLNVDIDQEAISAVSKDGIMTLTLPKPEEAKPRVIEVK